MTKHFFFLILTCILLDVKVSAQESLMIPREIKNALNRNTRSLTGTPGQAYWQNTMDYKIEASFDPQTGKITGKETIHFTNKSPNNLYQLVFNLYPNLYKAGNVRDRFVDSRDINNGVEINKILIDGVVQSQNERRIAYEGTRMNLILPKMLAPNDKISIGLEWTTTLPSNTKIRMGKYGINTWFIGYWYPQLAVYDDIFGWDEIDYDGLHEFYSAYANFDVKITCPAQQVVWATGIWQNPEQILTELYFSRYQQALESGKVVSIVKLEDIGKKITRAQLENVWHYKAENVTDFCFATSDNYLWDGVSVITDKKSNKKTFIQTAYNKLSKDFAQVAEISKKTIRYLSEEMPAIPFPYPRMTVFNGDDGMEYPMMVNDRSEYTLAETVNLTSHEISHTYFPFYMGINQERFSWMDEGWAMFLPSGFQERYVPYNNQKASSAFNYIYNAGKSTEMPMMVPSFYMKGFEYYTASYYRPEIALRVLENLLGKDLFLKALQEFIHRWNGKYPSPYDFFLTFNDVANQDLNWFWEPWYFKIAYPDLRINKIHKLDTGYSIDIENVGRLPLPVELTIICSDGTRSVISKTAEIWKHGENVIQISFQKEKTISRVNLGADWIPDTNSQDNERFADK